MPRGVRRSQAPRLPDGVKWATLVPIIVIPSDGAPQPARLPSERRMPQNSKREIEIRFRYPPCCDEHKAEMTLESLASAKELEATCNRMIMHYGHGRLRPERASLTFEKCEDRRPCTDCLEEFERKREEKEKAA